MRSYTALVTKCPVGIGQVLGSTFSTIITHGTAALAHHYTPASQRGWRGIPVRKRGGSVGSSHTHEVEGLGVIPASAGDTSDRVPWPSAVEIENSNATPHMRALPGVV